MKSDKLLSEKVQCAEMNTNAREATKIFTFAVFVINTDIRKRFNDDENFLLKMCVYNFIIASFFFFTLWT